MAEKQTQEEVFETEDVPPEEAELKSEAKEPEEPVQGVIEEDIRPTAAFQVFAGKAFDPTQPSTRNREYESTTKADSKFESPLQKFRRLQGEIAEFEKELASLSDKARDASDPTKELTRQLNEELTKMWSNVEDFKARPELAELFASSNAAVLDTVDAGHLFKRLQQFQAQAQGSGGGGGQSERAVFTLYHDGTLNHKAYRSQELDERLVNLERVIGPTPETQSVGDMMASVEFLGKRLDLLSDEMKLDILVRKAKTLKKELGEISIRKVTQEMENQIASVKEDKINKMFDMMKRWDASAQQLPTVIGRLQSLKHLHEESADVVTKVESLQSQQKLIGQTLQENKSILEKVTASLAANAQLMSQNMQAIEERMAQLSDKVGRLG